MRFLRTNTDVIITVGPFYDKTDGVTIETALTITNERITLTADTDAGSAPTNVLDNVTGAASGTSNDLDYIAGNDAGMMRMELAAADVNRLGRMFLSITDAANHVPVFHEFMVLPAMIYDAFILGTDVLDSSMTQILGTAVVAPATAGLLDVNVKEISTDATAANNLEADYDGTQNNAERPATAKFLADMIENQRGHHTWSGSVFYVDGFGGNDTTGNGSRLLPYKTISKAITQCTAGRHDIIECVPNSGAVPTIISETATITVSKSYVFIRGPGRGVQVDLTGAGYVFDITAEGVEISGFDIIGNGVGGSGGITVSTANFAYLHHLWITSPTQDGIQLTVSNNTLIDNVFILASGRDGVRVASGTGTGQ